MNICPILLAAIIQIESSGNPRAHNQREDAVGALQIRRILVDDLNRIYGPPYYSYKDRWDVGKSKEMFGKYLGYYGTQRRLGRKPTNEDFAKIWNSGPNGWKKNSSDYYWVKVEKQIKRLDRT
jgi:soluble lytic murein transglycosylase-like protein